MAVGETCKSRLSARVPSPDAVPAVVALRARSRDGEGGGGNAYTQGIVELSLLDHVGGRRRFVELRCKRWEQKEGRYG